MKTLLLLRHAKSSWNNPALADHDRPLNARGKSDAPRIGQLIMQQDLTPNLILSSTAKRARKTAQKVARHCDCPREVELCSSLYLAHPDAYLKVLAQQDDHLTRIMVVGHNPGLEQLLHVLTDSQETLPTAALAHLELEIDSWQQLNASTTARLVNLWRPKELP